MPRFAGTPRVSYTKARVREMRLARMAKKPKVEGVPLDVFQNRLGELLAAGHMKINGFKILNANIVDLEDNKDMAQRDYSIQFQQFQNKELGDKPHISGYLQSGNESDPSYRLHGWFNEDGTIRLELVK